MDVKERFDALKKKRDDAKTLQVQLNTKIDSAKDSISEIENLWKEKYNVSTYAEAQQLSIKMEKEITEVLDSCEEFLSKAGV